jgi:hypothetical protein
LPSSTGSVEDAARGVVIVKMLHMTTPAPSTCLALQVEAR